MPRRATFLATLTAALLPATAAQAAPPPAQAALPPAQPLRFGACSDSVPRPAAPDRVACARIGVPLDWNHPEGPRITVAISRVPASGNPAEDRGALLVNPGGPGGSGLPGLA
ncbi:hypothetical protein [Streptomyces sp. NPDC057280]|uniref:hypothetical protein n=1 Tax=Streptomyces sp. NPDC057280 TaxID=3346081 RepID=UPI00362AC922